MPHDNKDRVLLINVSFMLADAKIPVLAKSEKEHLFVSHSWTRWVLLHSRGHRAEGDFLFPTGKWEKEFTSGRPFLSSSAALSQLQRNNLKQLTKGVWLGSSSVVCVNNALQQMLEVFALCYWEKRGSRMFLSKFPFKSPFPLWLLF